MSSELELKLDYESSECSCARCREMCQIPCWTLPSETCKLIKSGFRRLLSVVEVPAVDASSGRRVPGPRIVAPTKTGNACVFYDQGLCTLHALGLKPFEGTRAHHSLSQPEILLLRKGIGEVWETSYGEEVVRMVEGR